MTRRFFAKPGHFESTDKTRNFFELHSTFEIDVHGALLFRVLSLVLSVGYIVVLLSTVSSSVFYL